MTIYEILAAIRATSSKLEKRAILAAHKDNTFLRDYLKAVYDPRIQYGIKKMPKASAKVYDGKRAFNEDDLSDMQNLATLTGGKAAKELLAGKLASLNVEGKALLTYLIARDVDAGMSHSTILSVWPGLYFIPPYQRCASMDPELKERFGEDEEFFVQTKSDGSFCYAIRRKDKTQQKQAMSRQGSLYPEWLANSISYAMPDGYVAMGELLVVRDGKVLDRKTGNGILNSVLSGDGTKFLQTDSLRFLAWDMVTEEEFDAGKSDRDYKDRWHDLCTRSGLARIPSWTVKSVREANRIHAEHKARKEEGTVWKRESMKWRDCSSGDPDMMKAKLVFEFEAKITGAYVHKKNPKMLGGFNMASSDGLIQFDVGSGFTKQQRLDFWSGVELNPDYFAGAVATCEGNDILTSKSKPGLESVSLPIFVELRYDKTEADSKARIWEQFEAARLAQ